MATTQTRSAFVGQGMPGCQLAMPFMTGKLKIKGDMSVAMALSQLIG
jgi:hypothetical protein